MKVVVSMFVSVTSYRSAFSRIRTEDKEISPPDAGKYGPEKTPYLDTFHAVQLLPKNISSLSQGAPS